MFRELVDGPISLLVAWSPWDPSFDLGCQCTIPYDSTAGQITKHNTSFDFPCSVPKKKPQDLCLRETSSTSHLGQLRMEQIGPTNLDSPSESRPNSRRCEIAGTCTKQADPADVSAALFCYPPGCGARKHRDRGIRLCLLRQLVDSATKGGKKSHVLRNTQAPSWPRAQGTGAGRRPGLW